MPHGDNNQSHLVAIFRAFLQKAGLAPGAFENLIDAAVRGDWGVDEFAMNLYSTKQFKAMFPGIFRADGSMRMDPFQYRQLVDTFKSTARMYGITGLGRKQTGKLIAHNVSVQEFSDRLTAVQRITEYKPAFQEFREAAKARGMKIGGINSDKEILNFILGKAPKKFYSLWDEVMTGTAARSAGVDLGQGQIRSISKRMAGLSSEAELQTRFQRLAQTMKSTLPLSKIAGYGITKKDLVTLEFGGENQAQIADTVEKILAQEEGFQQGPAIAARADFGGSMQEYAQTG